MTSYIIIFILIFSTLFPICLYSFIKKILSRENLYLIIPSICVGFWAILSLFEEQHQTPVTYDFKVFYYAGLQIYNNPANLYDIEGYLYLPVFAILFAISFCLLPLDLAAAIFFILNYIFAVLTIREYNKILMLMDVEKKANRFLFLMIISNGFYILYQFRFNQSKYLLFLILAFIMRRELQFNKEEKEKDFIYYLVNYSLMVFAIGIAPYFVFILIIYVLQDISFKEIFKIENVKKLTIILLMFIIQNILFLIYPLQIFEFLDGFNHPKRRNEKLKLIYLREFVEVSTRVITYLIYLSIITLSATTFILIYKTNMDIEEKFGYFAIAYILMGVYAYTHLLSLLLFSFVLLLFVPYLKENLKGVQFIKGNKYLLCGLFSIVAIFFSGSDVLPSKLNPIIQEYPFVIFYYARWIIFLCVMIISLILTHLKYGEENYFSNKVKLNNPLITK